MVMRGVYTPFMVYTSPMQEMSKATKRRYNDPAYHLWFYSGDGLDVGGGDDPLGRWCHAFARMTSCRTWDKADGDAAWLDGIGKASLDFVASSHCLEHLANPVNALARWLEVLKPGGFAVVSVPDAEMYEQGHWPSKWNADHKWRFTLRGETDHEAKIYNVVDFLRGWKMASVERLQLIRDFHSPALAGTDQTLLPNVESAIEFVLRKHG